MLLVAEVVPLKQGLKQNSDGDHVHWDDRCRGSSIKTRIETCYTFVKMKGIYFVAEVVPLKQGLKQNVYYK